MTASPSRDRLVCPWSDIAVVQQSMLDRSAKSRKVVPLSGLSKRSDLIVGILNPEHVLSREPNVAAGFILKREPELIDTLVVADKRSSNDPEGRTLRRLSF